MSQTVQEPDPFTILQRSFLRLITCYVVAEQIPARELARRLGLPRTQLYECFQTVIRPNTISGWVSRLGGTCTGGVIAHPAMATYLESDGSFGPRIVHDLNNTGYNFLHLCDTWSECQRHLPSIKELRKELFRTRSWKFVCKQLGIPRTILRKICGPIRLTKEFPILAPVEVRDRNGKLLVHTLKEETLLRETAEAFGISRERVRQIRKRSGLPARSDVMAQRKQAQADLCRDAVKKFDALGYMQTVRWLAAQLGIPEHLAHKRIIRADRAAVIRARAVMRRNYLAQLREFRASVGLEVDNLRHMYGYTTRLLSNISGVPKVQLPHIYHGRSHFTDTNLMRLAKVFGLPEAHFVQRRPERLVVLGKWCQ